MPLVTTTRPVLRWKRGAVGVILALSGATAFAQPRPLFEARSAYVGDDKMDIVIRETERRPRASVIDIEIRQMGSSVGSAFFLLCSVRNLARLRDGTGYIVKLEEHPRRGQMLIGFLNSADEPPGNADPAFADAGARAQVADLERFAPICDQMR